MDRYADWFDSAAGEADKAKTRPYDDEDEQDDARLARLPGKSMSALGGLEPNLLIRRSMEYVRSVRRNPDSQVSVQARVRHVRHRPAPSGQSVRKL